MDQINLQPEQSELGKSTEYDTSYNPARLYPIPRITKRAEIGIVGNTLPFVGFDLWNHYEVSWLNEKGKPMVAMATLSYPCGSPCIIESKSLKLYFNSFNNSVFPSVESVASTVKQDLEQAIGAPVTIAITLLRELRSVNIQPTFQGICVDDLDISCDTYTVCPSYLTTSTHSVTETLCSDLLKSNCLVTNQPDWGSVQVHYQGPAIDRIGLLRYIVSFRNHNEFHEQCIERIFLDILQNCQPEVLVVYGRYTRRGGIDINPYRATHNAPELEWDLRLARQ